MKIIVVRVTLTNKQYEQLSKECREDDLLPQSMLGELVTNYVWNNVDDFDTQNVSSDLIDNPKPSGV